MNLSIIIVSYNTKELLRKCLESVIRDQLSGISYQGSVVGKNKKPVTDNQLPVTEIIVVDNASKDGSVEYLRELVDNSPTTDHRSPITLRLIENKENFGFAKAANQGIRIAKGENILLLNSDTKLTENSLKSLLEFAEKVQPAVIGAQMLNPDGSVQGSCFLLPTVKRAILEYWLGKKDYFSKYYPKGDRPVEVEAVSGGAMLVSKEIVNEVGMLDERYFMYFEDLDFCRRARKAGYKIYYLPSSKIIHEHGASGKKLAEPKDQWRRLVPSSKIYHGSLNHFLITFIILSGQKIRKLFTGKK
ncbi:glycosyltransferase family 2 protein [Candidatus Microgenomates bacterium]|jgi:GT2 family glycosyltransferase|nr:MAG: glycosyltransferase family 2 protein [Candidatus Microgenomates bacterium]